MPTETLTAPPMLASAQRWADYLDFAFAEIIGDTNPIAIEPGVDAHGDHQLTIAGVVVSGDYRHRSQMDTAAFVASRLASPVAHRATLEWFDYLFEAAGFIGWMHAEHYVGDSKGFYRWLDEFKRAPAKWTVEYVASKACKS